MVSMDRSFLEFPRVAKHLLAMALSQPLLAHSMSPRLQKVAFKITHGVVIIHSSHWFATSGPSRAVTPKADVIWVEHKSTNDTFALLVDLDLEDAKPNTRYHELGPFHVDITAFAFLASFACLELGGILRQCVCNDHMVINIKFKGLSRRTSAELR